MSLNPITTPCVIETPGTPTTDADGVPTQTPTTTTTVCEPQPYQATPEEVAAGQVYAEGRLRVWFPPGTAITADSVLDLGDDKYPILGEPKRWEFGSDLDHVEAIAGRFTSGGVS